jgi:hypothetical protein
MPSEVIDSIERALDQIKGELEQYAAHLRPLDRKRLNGVGIKKDGFVEGVYEFVRGSPGLLPRYLTAERFGEAHKYYKNVRSLSDLGRQINELLRNIAAQASDAVYTYSLDYYAASREAARRRIDGAETVHNKLEAFFRHKKAAGGELTEKQVKSHVNALLRNKRDGKIVVENVRPRLTGGKHKVIDEHSEDDARYKDTEEGGINE